MDTTTETTWHPTWHAFVAQIVRTDRQLAVRVTGPTHTADVPVDRGDLLTTLAPLANTGDACQFHLTAMPEHLLVVTSGDPF